MMKGTVCSTNLGRKTIAIATGAQEFTIVAGDADEFRVGDIVEWDNATALGPQTYRNVTQGFEADVVVQNHWASLRQLQEALLP